jgi:hypothetical protein
VWCFYNLIIATELFRLEIADWVAESVLSKEDARKRANIVKHLIGVADVSLLLPSSVSLYDGVASAVEQ